MAAFKLNLKIDQGATFQKLVTWKTGAPAVAVNLTSCTARAHLRAKITSPDILMTLTTENGGIALGGATGTVVMNINAATTAGLTWLTAVYDLEIVFANGTIRRLMAGNVTVSPEVTR